MRNSEVISLYSPYCQGKRTYCHKKRTRRYNLLQRYSPVAHVAWHLIVVKEGWIKYSSLIDIIMSLGRPESVQTHFYISIINTIFSFFRTGVNTSYICKKRGSIFLLTNLFNLINLKLPSPFLYYSREYSETTIYFSIIISKIHSKKRKEITFD